MTETKLAPNLPQWMKDHAQRYLSSGGADGHMYTIVRPGTPELAVPSLLLTTTGRKSGEKYLFPLFYGQTGSSYFVIASKGGAPEHPGWYVTSSPTRRSISRSEPRRCGPARTATGEERAQLWEQAVKFFPPYADYRVKAGAREIPVVVLDPVT